MDFPINITKLTPRYAFAVFPSDWCLCGLISLRLYSSYNHKNPKYIHRNDINKLHCLYQFTFQHRENCLLTSCRDFWRNFPDDPWVNEKLSNYFSRRPLTLLFFFLAFAHSLSHCYSHCEVVEKIKKVSRPKIKSWLSCPLEN